MRGRVEGKVRDGMHELRESNKRCLIMQMGKTRHMYTYYHDKYIHITLGLASVGWRV